MTFVLFCSYKGREWETLEECETEAEAERLKLEYQLAFGKDFTFLIRREW